MKDNTESDGSDFVHKFVSWSRNKAQYQQTKVLVILRLCRSLTFFLPLPSAVFTPITSFPFWTFLITNQGFFFLLFHFNGPRLQSFQIQRYLLVNLFFFLSSSVLAPFSGFIADGISPGFPPTASQIQAKLRHSLKLNVSVSLWCCTHWSGVLLMLTSEDKNKETPDNNVASADLFERSLLPFINRVATDRTRATCRGENMQFSCC